jgi:hypothetical protein
MATPAEFLEQLQRQAQGMSRTSLATLVEEREEDPDPDLERSILESVGMNDERRLAAGRREFRKQIAAARQTIPTRLEDLNSHMIMKHLARQLEKAAEQQELDLPRMPVYGSLPVGQLNAMAIRVPGQGEYLIAFQNGVFSFANLLTKAVARSFRLKGIIGDGTQAAFGWKLRDFRRSWAKDDEPLRRFGEFLHAYLVFGDAHQADHYLVQDPFHLPAYILREGFELFLFGHELGHIVAGHLGSAPDAPHMLGAMAVDVPTSSWQMELEADGLGMDLAMQAMLNNRCDLTTSYAGIEMAFTAMEIIDLARSTLLGGRPSEAPAGRTHPRHAVRRMFLRRLLQQRLGKKAAKQPIKFAETLERVLHEMWRRVEPRFKVLHAEAERPSPIWSPW